MKGTSTRKTYARMEIVAIFDDLELADVETFDSRQSNNCLFCEKWSECRDTESEEVKEKSIKGIQRGLDLLDEYEDSEVRSRLMREGEGLKGRVWRTGTYPASNLFLIGRK